MSTEEAIRQWLRQIRPSIAEHTYTLYSMVLWRFSSFAPARAKDLTVEHIENYLQSILDQFSNRTANAHLTAIKSFCRWFSAHYDLPNPASKVHMLPEAPPKQRVLTPDELQKVLAVCKPDESKVITFLANTGLRASEAQSLRSHHIHDHHIAVVGKGQKRRVVPVNKTVEACLDSQRHINFLRSYHTKNALYKLCMRLSERAKISPFGPHALRHYFATELMRRGVPVAKVSKILGHTSIRTTEQIYVHFVTNDLLGATDVLDR